MLLLRAFFAKSVTAVGAAGIADRGLWLCITPINLIGKFSYFLHNTDQGSILDVRSPLNTSSSTQTMAEVDQGKAYPLADAELTNSVCIVGSTSAALLKSRHRFWNSFSRPTATSRSKRVLTKVRHQSMCRASSLIVVQLPKP